jgi:hypothetical protein
MSTEILVRRETADEHLAVGATYMDDIDLIMSPNGGHLVVVAVKKGRHVCQQCGDGFDHSVARSRPVEVCLAPGSPPVLLHAGCQTPGIRVFLMQKFRGLEIRRKFARAVKGSSSIEKAAESSANKIVGG